MDYLYKRHPKGTYEYADYKKKVDIAVMLFLFALALGLYIIGRVATGSNRNILTIVAVLGLLPACKMVVDVIMCFRVKSCEQELKSRIDASVGKLYGMYNMYFTSYNKNYLIAHLVLSGNSVIGLCTDKGFDEKSFKEHLGELLIKEGIKDVMIKVFTDDKRYITRLTELNEAEGAAGHNISLETLIRNVTL